MKEPGRKNSYRDNQRTEESGRSSNVLKAPVCVGVCWFPAAAPLMSPEKVSQHIPMCLRVSLCAKACLDLNNNGGSDPDRCFTAATPSHSENVSFCETPPPPFQRSDAVGGSAGSDAKVLRQTSADPEKYADEESPAFGVEFQNRCRPF